MCGPKGSPLDALFEEMEKEGVRWPVSGVIVRLETGHELWRCMTMKQVNEIAARAKGLSIDFMCIPVEKVSGDFTEIRKKIAELNKEHGLPGTMSLLNTITLTSREKAKATTGACA